MDVTLCGSISQLIEMSVPNTKIKRQANYYVSQRFLPDDVNPSNDFSENFDQDTEGPNVKPVNDSIDANDSIDSNNSSDIDDTTGTSTVSSETKLVLPTDLKKPITRSRKPLNHRLEEELREFNNNVGKLVSNFKKWEHENHTGGNSNKNKLLSYRRNKSWKRDVQKWNNINTDKINKNSKGISRSIIKKRPQKKKLSLISFNEIRTNNNINNNNNAAGSTNLNTVGNGLNGLIANGSKSGQNNCLFIVCLGLYVNDAILTKNTQKERKRLRMATRNK